MTVHHWCPRCSATEKKLGIALAFIRDRAEGLQGEDPKDVLWVITHIPLDATDADND